ncbi:hypothetical protein OG520_44365 (plasmid) [Streptomyces sp. NBC_00984]|uniref:hypothetical protein n=1 Tax=Streptomyces sp. NBC_00984 TaxID=2903700 RepID=UPI00386CB884|nr:hypothetical protein OG520_44365 [Streptomyces sp. NBC_00984]
MRGTAPSGLEEADNRPGLGLRSTVLVACLAFFVITLDTTVVNVALPSLLREVGEDCHPPQTADITDRLNRVLAVLLLDIPAVRTLATALATALDTPQDTDIQNTYEQIRTAWATAGIC